MISLNLLHGCHHLEAVLLSAGMDHLIKGCHLMVGTSELFCAVLCTVINALLRAVLSSELGPVGIRFGYYVFAPFQHVTKNVKSALLLTVP